MARWPGLISKVQNEPGNAGPSMDNHSNGNVTLKQILDEALNIKEEVKVKGKKIRGKKGPTCVVQ